MVFVVDKKGKPLAPCHPAKARKLLAKKKAYVHRREPFTIRLDHEVEGPVEGVTLKIDPGSRHTGLSILQGNKVLWLGQLEHRTDISTKLARRAMYRHRRRGNLRYRKERFLNRRKPEGWFAPSIMHRVTSLDNIIAKLRKYVPVVGFAFENVKFDLQLMENPNIEGIEYQQGTLQGYEIREFLLYYYGHTCQYCGGASGDPILEWEHMDPKSRGGTDRLSNAALACHTCNQDKKNRTLEEWFAYLTEHPKKSALHKARLKLLPKAIKKKGCPQVLTDAGIINSVRWIQYNHLKATGLPVERGTGGMTKFNRTNRGLAKEHCIDSVCVGKSTPKEPRFKTDECQIIKAEGRGSYCRTIPDKYGFPRGYCAKQKNFFGFRSGDIVKANVPSGKRAGVHIGAVACRKTGSFDIRTANGRAANINYKHMCLLQSADGYSYSKKKISIYA